MHHHSSPVSYIISTKGKPLIETQGEQRNPTLSERYAKDISEEKLAVEENRLNLSDITTGVVPRLRPQKENCSRS
jgi:hypothetical protein